ncbi:MAG: amidohydrolase family protein [Nocardioidaceae bacterium]
MRKRRRNLSSASKILPRNCRKRDAWISNGNWGPRKLTPANLPTKEMIDAATPNNPAFINRLDGHMALANSAALKLAGVDKNTKEVEGGVIVRDVKGEPTELRKTRR